MITRAALERQALNYSDGVVARWRDRNVDTP